MKSIIISFLLFAAITVSGQSSEPILTKEDNATWITALEKEDLPKQMEMIKTRWQQDADFHYEVAANPHKIISDNRVSPKCRPLYMINKEEEGQIIFPANPSSEKVAAVSKLLSPGNISEVEVASKSTQLIYGQRGSCGVIYITVAENAIFDRIASELRQ